MNLAFIFNRSTSLLAVLLYLERKFLSVVEDVVCQEIVYKEEITK